MISCLTPPLSSLSSSLTHIPKPNCSSVLVCLFCLLVLSNFLFIVYSFISFFSQTLFCLFNLDTHARTHTQKEREREGERESSCFCSQDAHTVYHQKMSLLPRLWNLFLQSDSGRRQTRGRRRDKTAGLKPRVKRSSETDYWKQRLRLQLPPLKVELL